MMNCSRRELSFLLPMLAAVGEGRASAVALPSAIYKFEELPVSGSGPSHSRAILKGETHENCPVELHETELEPGAAPHPPHHHAHEEAILMWEGTVEVTISGKSTTIGPGSVAYVASGEEHGWKNVGLTRARYFVLALGRDQS
jgi:quercetin dioxygenase-like cupin family protein